MNYIDDAEKGMDNIIPVNIEDEMKTAYIDYSMSVIVSRALPDVRDGLKPVHRRVFYGMQDLGLSASKPYKKSARIVGEVLGKYHPHGDSSVYDAMVRLAQEWSLRYPMVDGQGNFGSIDGDNPAAMRYTEARLKNIAEDMLMDIKKDTVDFRLNFDDSLEEPTVLPAKIPNLIVNGSSGIAVGMATNMAPHNLSETIDATIAFIDNNDITIDELMKFIKAPDFPTRGAIYGYEGVRDAFHTGRGRIVLRGKAVIEEEGDREKIIVTEIPYLVNKSVLIEKTAELLNDKKIEGIADIRDESDRNGIRIVYDIKRDANSSVVLNNLFKHTQLQSSFSINNIALVNGRPLQLNIKDLIKYFVQHRHEVVVRRTEFDLKEAEKKAEILQGLLIAIDNLDAVIHLIRNSKTPDIASEGLISQFSMTENQAKAVLAMTLRRLTGLEQEKIRKEHQELVELMKYLNEVLADESLRMKIIKDELFTIKEKYGDERRTEIIFSSEEFDAEDFIVDEPVVLTISHEGYVKRTPLSEYRKQVRGGKGAIGSTSKNEDFIEHLLIATNHNYLLIFTDRGKCYWLRVFETPEANKTSKGRAIQNLIQLDKNEKVKAYLIVENLKDEEYLSNNFIVLCTERGVIKKMALSAFSKPRAGGIRAIDIREGDSLLMSALTDGQSEIMMASSRGRCVRFNESQVRTMGRTAFGIRGIRLSDEKDKAIGMVTVNNAEEQSILVVSEKGLGKRTEVEAYRVTARGGKGVTTLKINEKVGQLVSLLSVYDSDELMIITKSGIAIRMGVSGLRKIGRATQGVRLIDLRGKDEIASVEKIEVSKILKDENLEDEEPIE